MSVERRNEDDGRVRFDGGVDEIFLRGEDSDVDDVVSGVGEMKSIVIGVIGVDVRADDPDDD